MPNLTNSALRLLRRVLGAPSRSNGPYAGTGTVLDGNTAVAVTEAGISESAALSASFPADAAVLGWRCEQARRGSNLNGAALGSLTAESPRGALAAATGLTLAGTRAACFLSGPDLAGAIDLLTAATGRHLPLVVHVANRALPSHCAGSGSGHEALHLAADSGCFILFAANVQETVDFALIARRVAEQALIPGLVVMDGEQTALSIQQVRLPPSELAKRMLGAPDDEVPAPTPAQRLLFGDTRRRIPRWHDPDRPVMLGGLQSTESWGLGRAARHAFCERHLAECLNEAIEQFEHLSGRRRDALSTHRMDDARLVLVVQGAAIETAEAVADGLRRYHRCKAGVVGLRALRPFPGAEIARLLGQGRRVCVLERLDGPAETDPPLLRELRTALGRALENGRRGIEIHAGYPPLSERRMPRLLSVIYGLGGLPLRAADLIELGRHADAIDRPRIYLGINFAPGASPYPKRQILLDRLRRSYPEIADLGMIGAQPVPDLRPQAAIGVALHRISGQLGEGLVPEIAALLHHLLQGQIRGRPALCSMPWGALCLDRIAFAPAGLRDAGDDMRADLALVTADPAVPGLEPLAGLTPAGALLVATGDSGEGLWDALNPKTRRLLKDRNNPLYHLPAMEHSHNDYLLGGICAVLVDAGLVQFTHRRLVSSREALLQQSVGDFQRQLEAFKTGLAAVQRIDHRTLATDPVRTPAEPEDEAPALLRRLGTIDDSYDNLPRFWDQVGVLHHHGATTELAPDPYLALGAVPPLSSGFRDLSPLRSMLPAFKPAQCTGCGDCWSACPDSAIDVRLLAPTRLIDAGIRRTGADALRPIAGRLAARLSAICTEESTGPTTIGMLLAAAFAQMKDKMLLPAERTAAITQAVKEWTDGLVLLPVAVTEPFFKGPERQRQGAGELLALAINPGACKGCGICVRACEQDALAGEPQDASALQQGRRNWNLLQWLPDTEPATIERAGNHPDVGPMPAALLARRPAQSLAGGDGAEPGSGARLALRLALAAAETQQAAASTRLLDNVRGARDGIAKLIRDTLADALPADDLETLARGLASVETRQAELRTLIGTAEETIDNAVDTARLRRLIELARGLGDLFERLHQGRHGLGRARVGLVLASRPSTGWSGLFPNNPFPQPVTIDSTADGAQLAAGLLEGQLRQTAADIALIRRAQLELEHPADAARRWSELDGLSWRDLTVEELATCPSMLLMGAADLLGGHGLAQVFQLLGSDLPIRMMLLADLDLGLAGPTGLDSGLSAVDDAGIKLGLLALAQRGALVAQTSLGAPEHFLESVEAAFAYRGPALLHLHAPSPARHGFATDRTLQRARSATRSRVFPLFRYHPEGSGVFGSRLTLEGNPAPRADWAADDDAEPVTPAHWALGETRFAECLEALADDAPGPMCVTDYLALDANERRGKTPFVSAANSDGKPVRYRVGERLVQVCEERCHAWRTLQELSGLVTPFTERVRHEAEAAVAEDRRSEQAAQAAQYEQRLQHLRAELHEAIRHDMRARLMRLAGYDSQPDNSDRLN